MLGHKLEGKVIQELQSIKFLLKPHLTGCSTAALGFLCSGAVDMLPRCELNRSP